MSEELNDEIEAINSIYGDGSLVPYPANGGGGGGESDTYILQLPGEDPSSLRLQFPPAYPAEPPSVLGTHSAGENARRGAAARDLQLFRDAVAAVYQPGQVCLFDALEELSRQLETLQEAAAAAAAAAEDPEEEASPPPASQAYDDQDGGGLASDDADDLGPEPAWTLSDPIAENKSVFLARAAPASSPAEAARCVAHLLATDRRARAATHNITAWRIRSSPGAAATVFQDCDDDGETAAGGRLLHLLQLMDAWGLVVVVTRWYGGQKLGPRRFALINQAARDAVVKGGFVADPAEQQQAGGKKKGHGR